MKIKILAVALILLSSFPITAIAQDKPAKKPSASWTPVQLALCNPVQLFDENYNVYGLRLNLLYGKNRNVYGIDLGVGVNHANDVKGLQLGLVNMGRDVQGVPDLLI